MAVEWGKKGLLSEKTRWFNEIWEKGHLRSERKM